MEDQAEKFRQQKKYNQLLLLAAARGYAKDVEALVELGAALDHKDKKGLTALHYAAGSGRLEVVRYLWTKGAEVDAESPDGRTPLHLACLKGHAEVATFLIQKGGWVGSEDARDNTPLHLAASRGHEAAAEALLKHGASLAATNKHGLTPLGSALVKGQSEVARRLLGWGAGVGERPGGFGLLHLAAGSGQLEGVRLLLEKGAGVNDCDNPERSTPLHSAALSCEPAVVEALLQAGADASAADAEGRLPADLLPEGQDSKQVAAVRELLGAAARKEGAKKGSKGPKPAAAPKSPHEAFKALPDRERRSKLELWATMSFADLAAALAEYPAGAKEEVAQRVAAMQAARAKINIQKAMAAGHADEEFQADAAQPHVREAVDALRADPSKYDQYAADPVILSVLGKLRRLHGVCQANGQRTLNLEEVLIKPGSNIEERDALQLAALESDFEAHLAAAVAAAAADGEQAAAAAGDAFSASQEAAKARLQEQAAAARAAARAAQAPAAAREQRAEPSLLRQRGGAAAAKQGGGGGGAAAAGGAAEEDAAAAAALEELEGRGRRDGGGTADEDEENLPDWLKGGFSWKKVWQEFWRQTQLALLVLVGFLLVAWVFRGRPPWEGGPRPGAGGSSGDDLAAALLQGGGGGVEEEGGVAHAEL